jgi:RimJ/RimL family protein N-acetyltransferase
LRVWVRPSFDYPARLDLPSGHHLRPIRAADAEIDLPAVMGARDRLFAQYGEAWGWPPEETSLETDRQDLAHHEEEMHAHEGFNYAILDRDQERLLGCVYIYPSEAEADADVSWWLVDAALGTELERALEEAVPAWLAETWGMSSIRRHP